MKALRLFQLYLVGALALGIMILWIGVSPSAAVADSLVGGTEGVEGDCCSSWETRNCSSLTDPVNGSYNCGGTTRKICPIDSSGSQQCAEGTNNDCYGTTGSHPDCDNKDDMTCD